MPNFKPKNSKNIKVSQQSIVTLDGKHKQIVNKLLNNEKEIIPKLEKNNKNEYKKIS